jgi:peptidoglycan-associated lipoprotein
LLLSNRAGTRAVKSKGKTCCDDIYNVSLKLILADLMATVFDADTKAPLSGARLQLIDMTEDEVKGQEVEAKTNANSNDFAFALSLDRFYRILATRDDYYSDTLEFNTMGLLDSKTFEIPVNLKPMPVYITISREEPIELEYIFYDFDDDKILPAAEPDLKFVLELMSEYPDMVIELSSHTDARRRRLQPRAVAAPRRIRAPLAA